jgi:hypothetical protein
LSNEAKTDLHKEFIENAFGTFYGTNLEELSKQEIENRRKLKELSNLKND